MRITRTTARTVRDRQDRPDSTSRTTSILAAATRAARLTAAARPARRERRCGAVFPFAQANFFFLIFSINFDELCVFLSPTKIALISSFLSVSRSGSVFSVYSVPFA